MGNFINIEFHLNFISLISKNSYHMKVRPLDNEKFRVLQIFSTKATLFEYFASVFMLFYLLLNSIRAYKMHAFRIA